ETTDEVVALSWYVFNNYDEQLRVKRYYPLRPGHALLHADWTSPAHRGRGLHKLMLTERVHIIRSRYAKPEIESAILPSNVASARNYQNVGFVLRDHLRVISWASFSSGRFRR